MPTTERDEAACDRETVGGDDEASEEAANRSTEENEGGHDREMESGAEKHADKTKAIGFALVMSATML